MPVWKGDAKQSSHTKSSCRGRGAPIQPQHPAHGCFHVHASYPCWKGTGKVFHFKVKSFCRKWALQKSGVRDGVLFLQEWWELFALVNQRNSWHLASAFKALSTHAWTQGIPPIMITWGRTWGPGKRPGRRIPALSQSLTLHFCTYTQLRNHRMVEIRSQLWVHLSNLCCNGVIRSKVPRPMSRQTHIFGNLQGANSTTSSGSLMHLHNLCCTYITFPTFLLAVRDHNCQSLSFWKGLDGPQEQQHIADP